MAQILVVDDEEGVRSFLAEALELDDHEVETAADGEQALEILRERSFDVVLTDLKMPRVDGMTLLARLREDEPSTEVIVLTAHGTVDVAVDAMHQGAFDFLQKPVSSPAELRLLVKRAAERRLLRLRSEGAARALPTPKQTLSYGDPAMDPVVDALQKVARTDATVLLVGESGTGKEVASRALHAWSGRRDGPFAAINCAAISAQLLESELFGHEKGAFTGAHAQRRGRLELADGGTFFLDEVGELALDLQAKLLRVLETRSFERVGGTRTLRANVRWVAATNRDLKAMIAAGTFREDLYHRLAVFPIRLPALRERPEDLAPLARQLLEVVGAEFGLPGLTLSEAVVTRLQAYSWPGNVRELRNTLERAVILADGASIGVEHLWLDPSAAPSSATPAGVPGVDSDDTTLEALERRAIVEALAAVDGNRKNAAERLGIGVRTLYDKLKRYDL